MHSVLKLLRNSIWFHMFLLLAFFQPEYLLQNALLNSFFNVMELVGFLLICVLWFVDIRKHIQKTFNILFLLLWAELFVSTLLSDDASLHFYLIRAVPVFGSCFMVEEIALHSPTKGLKSMYLYFSAIVLINTMTVFLYPNAMYANNRGVRVCWFLGEDNGGYAYYIIASTVAMLYCRCIIKRITAVSLMVWICSFVFVFHNDIATGIACQLLWVVLVICSYAQWLKKLQRPRLALYLATGGFFFLVVSRKVILEPITVALHRSITLSGRTKLWDIVLKRIQIKLLFGYGVTDGNTFDRINMNNGLLNAHNWLLMLTFYGGIIATILFCLLIYFACRKDRTRQYTNFDWCIAIGLIVLTVRFLVEAGNMMIYFLLLTMSAYTGEFVENLSRKREVPAFAIRFRFRRLPRIHLSIIRRR